MSEGPVVGLLCWADGHLLFWCPDGDWPEVEKLCTRQAFKNYRAILYMVYKQSYLELIDRGEYQKAYSHLGKRLKPLENLTAGIGTQPIGCYPLCPPLTVLFVFFFFSLSPPPPPGLCV